MCSLSPENLYFDDFNLLWSSHVVNDILETVIFISIIKRLIKLLLLLLQTCCQRCSKALCTHWQMHMLYVIILTFSFIEQRSLFSSDWPEHSHVLFICKLYSSQWSPSWFTVNTKNVYMALYEMKSYNPYFIFISCSRTPRNPSCCSPWHWRCHLRLATAMLAWPVLPGSSDGCLSQSKAEVSPVLQLLLFWTSLLIHQPNTHWMFSSWNGLIWY